MTEFLLLGTFDVPTSFVGLFDEFQGHLDCASHVVVYSLGNCAFVVQLLEQKSKLCHSSKLSER